MAIGSGLSPRMRGNPITAISRARSAGSIPTHAGKPRAAGPIPHGLGVYPHACGETGTDQLAAQDPGGLSPRMRGNRGCRWRLDPENGSIPTHAGKPFDEVKLFFCRGVYPHACGETIATRTSMCAMRGLSPRMRGNPDALPHNPTDRGSIPTHAGKPDWPFEWKPWMRVYPHACGETSSGSRYQIRLPGLSPRMRGNLNPGG